MWMCSNLGPVLECLFLYVRQSIVILVPLLCFLHLEEISIKILGENLEIQSFCISQWFLWETGPQCFKSLVLKKNCRGSDRPSTLLLATIFLVKIKSDPWWALVPNKGITAWQKPTAIPDPACFKSWVTSESWGEIVFPAAAHSVFVQRHIQRKQS